MSKKHDISDMTEEEREAYEKLHEKFELVPKKELKKTHSKKNISGSKNIFTNTLDIVKQPLYAKRFLVVSALFGIIYTFLYGLWRIPIIDFGINRMSPIGISDYAYLILITTLTGIIFSLLKYEKIQIGKSNISGSTPTAMAGIVSAVCPVCQGIQIIALGGTIAALPLAFLVPYIGLIQFITILILGFALYLKAHSIFTQTCITCKVDAKIEYKEKPTGKDPFLFRSNIASGAVMVLVLLLIVNNFLITTAFATAGTSSGFSVSSSGVSIKSGFEYGTKVTLKPMPLASGESPRIQGYRTIVKPLPTISELSLSPSTGDVAQDLVNNVVPRGTPWYGQEAGVSFDDPISAQNLWTKGRAIQLSPEEQTRWERIVNSFTCDYCCGTPQNPTIITRCGCAHSAAAQGMAKWFIQNYGDKYSDEEIYGEMARWYAVWYPGPTVNRIAQELDVAN